MDSCSLLASVIILGHNGRRFLDGCLGSVLDQDLSDSCYEVIYADNGSTDGSIDYVRKTFPEVQSVSLGHNLGFARGNNEAVKYSKGRYLVFLNQDTIVHQGWLWAMLEAMASNAQLGACHANMIMPWHEDFATLDRVQYPSKVYVADINRCGFVEYRQIPMQSSPIPTLFLSGACFLIDRLVMQQLPYLFDSRFFMYCEDLDLAFRIKALGYSIALVPEAVVYHLHYTPKLWGFRELRNAFWATRNRILAYYKMTGQSEFLRLLPRLVSGAPMKVFQVGRNRIFQSMAFLGMIPVTFVSTMAAFVLMRSYASERKYWSQRRAGLDTQSCQEA